MIIIKGPLDKLEAAKNLCKQHKMDIVYVDEGSPHCKDIKQTFWLKAIPPEDVDPHDSEQKYAYDDDLVGCTLIHVYAVVRSLEFRRHRRRWVDLYNDIFHEVRDVNAREGITLCGKKVACSMMYLETRENHIKYDRRECKICAKISKNLK